MILNTLNYHRRVSVKRLLFFVLFLSLNACDKIYYDAETRLVFQTKVLNSDNTPIANAHVQISVSDNYPSGGSLISQGKTDANGNITLIFPAPKNANGINLKIYSDDTSYLQKEVSNINPSDFVNYKFVLNNAYLLKENETAALNLNYSQTYPWSTLKKIRINGIYTAFPDYYNSPTSNSSFLLPVQILLKKNQAFQLKYTSLNTQTNAETDQTVNLQIDNDPIVYTINY